LKVLAVTGRVAEAEVQRVVSGLEDEVDVFVMPVTVAAFLTPEIIARNLENKTLTHYDMILVPGTVSGDVSVVEKVTGIPTYKGPIHASEIPLALDPEVTLSKEQSANLILREQLRDKALFEIRKVEENWKRVLKNKGGILVGKDGDRLPIGNGFPMRVIAEIVNAPLLDLEIIEQKAVYYENQGAQIVDVGMLAGKPMPKTIENIFQTIRNVTDLPISIDSLDPHEINVSLDLDVDLVLSLDAGNIEEITSNIEETAFVVLPTNMKDGFLPLKPEERVRQMENNIRLAKERGVKKIIADLVVEPLIKPGLMGALESYRIFKRKYSDMPILFGMGNVTELIDADSVGVNATITALASEVGANILHIPEYSDKAYGSVKEAVTASKMMWLAQMKGALPKDLGIDLLVLKEKRKVGPDYDSDIERNYDVIRGYPEDEFIMDPEGWFKIIIDGVTNSIAAIHYNIGEEEPDIIIKGSNSREIYQTIIRENLISKFDHAAYLGKELEKAYIALKLGRSYIQDDSLFS
jgi:dihydropteroate synthase-like protein